MVLPGVNEAVHIISSVLVSYNRLKPRKILLWHKADMEIIATYFLCRFYDNILLILLLANIWNEFKILCETCLDFIPLPDIPALTIQTEGVTRFRATGPDNTLAIILKLIVLQIGPLLTPIFQASINQGRTTL